MRAVLCSEVPVDAPFSGCVRELQLRSSTTGDYAIIGLTQHAASHQNVDLNHCYPHVTNHFSATTINICRTFTAQVETQ